MFTAPPIVAKSFFRSYNFCSDYNIFTAIVYIIFEIFMKVVDTVKIKQIRNATLKIEYGGKTFLIDAWLIDKQKFGRFVDIPKIPFRTPDPVKMEIPMPICGLPESVEEILSGVDYYILTHIHPDHIDLNFADGTVGAPLDKNKKIFAQDSNDAEILKRSGFKSIEILGENNLGEIKITKTPARHGTINPMGAACGVIFQAPNEKTLYLVGDSIFYEGVQETLEKFQPDVVILNACAAELIGNGRLIMNDEDVLSVATVVPNAQIIISHMDNVAHATITRHEMRGLLARRNVKYFMPNDGETLTF